MQKWGVFFLKNGVKALKFGLKINLNAKEGGEPFREREDIEKLERGVTKRGDLRGLCGSWGWVWVEEW